MSGATVFIIVVTGLFILDRAGKAWIVSRFFARSSPPPSVYALREPPANGWPDVALIQPVTHGASRLAENLHARASLIYQGVVYHLIVCDRTDTASQAICRTAFPHTNLILVEPDMPPATTASKIAKMTAGVAQMGNAQVICFVDDDILLPPDALHTLVAPLYGLTPAAGATFGLACQVSWRNNWEALMSGFVNANALIGYVPLSVFTPPYTITGHVFALRRDVFEKANGLNGLVHRFDDDHEIARRVRGLGLRIVQTPLIYQVTNDLLSFAAYLSQMRRWFVIPRESMVPFLTPREKAVSGLLSLGNILPTMVLLAAFCHAPKGTACACIAVTFAAFLTCYAGLEARYLPQRTPLRGLLLLPIVAFLTPLHILLVLLLPSDRILWRGQTYRAKRGGELQVDEK